MLYNVFRRIIMIFLGIYTLFDKDKRDFIKKRINQDYSLLGKENYVWVHCASVGEINLSETFTKLILKEEETKVLLTCLTDTGMEIAKEKYKESNNISLLYFPLDDKGTIKKILNQINLKMLILVETEIWPNLINLTKNYKTIIINGRISDKSYGRYKKVKFLLKNILKKIDKFYMQSQEDREKVINLGAPTDSVEVVGNLKFDVKMTRYSCDEVKNYKKQLGIKNQKVFVAGSVRSGEYEIILDVFRNLKNVLLILAPRHINKVSSIENWIKKNNLTYKKYSDLEEKSNYGKTEIILVDEIGHLRKLYSICDVAFVGGTLVNIGGHSLLEPLFYHKTPIFGPYLQNVKDISKEIIKKNIGYLVHDREELLSAVNSVLKGENQDKIDKINKLFSKNSNIAEKLIKRIGK